MAIGSGVPLSGPGPPHKSRRHVVSHGNRKSHTQTSSLEVSSALIRSLFDKQSRIERGRILQTSNHRPSDNVGDLLRQCISALVLESSDRGSSLVCDAVVRDFKEGKNRFSRPLNTLEGCDQSVFLSTIGTGSLEACPSRFGIEEHPPFSLTGDDRHGSAARRWPEQLLKASNPGGYSSISDLSAIKQVHFHWFKKENAVDSLGNGSVGPIPIGSSRQEEGLSIPGRPENSFSESCEVSKMPRETARGWEVIKAGMEKVLDRPLVSAQKPKLSNTLPPSIVPVQESDAGIAITAVPGTEASNKGGLSSVLVTNGAGLHAEHQNPTAVEYTNRATVCTPSRRMGDNAMAGALAGICVSLCLHPVDTVKTVIQAQSFGQRSVFRNLLAILSSRGVSGLYRGLASNLASSAPISAIYAFTYESVKASLLPHLPKEYHAIAYCAAGGCASIATSIVYTPSECVKQRMQVGSLYRNSWLAFLGILRNGGLSVLYSGWGAVLCRNVPQSVIKFYTYEGLKHYALKWHPIDTSPNTWQTVAFGGLAGSTAAFFTTPFDVIKTRLQTQVPGSVIYQKGVLQAFQHIAASEGIGGLYRQSITHANKCPKWLTMIFEGVDSLA